MEANDKNSSPTPICQDPHVTFSFVILTFPTTFSIPYSLYQRRASYIYIYIRHVQAQDAKTYHRKVQLGPKYNVTTQHFM